MSKTLRITGFLKVHYFGWHFGCSKMKTDNNDGKEMDQSDTSLFVFWTFWNACMQSPSWCDMLFRYTIKQGRMGCKALFKQLVHQFQNRNLCEWSPWKKKTTKLITIWSTLLSVLAARTNCKKKKEVESDHHMCCKRVLRVKERKKETTLRV
jgi:hypothetical protein